MPEPRPIALRVLVNRCNRELVDGIDHPDVRNLEIMPIMRRLAGDDLAAWTGDRFTCRPELHAAGADELARIIDEWARPQRHLAAVTDGAAGASDSADHETSTATG